MSNINKDNCFTSIRFNDLESIIDSVSSITRSTNPYDIIPILKVHGIHADALDDIMNDCIEAIKDKNQYS